MTRIWLYLSIAGIVVVDMIVAILILRGKKGKNYSHLVTGWDGYNAKRPTILAIRRMGEFLDVLENYELEPVRIKPSVAGGVGITFRNCCRKCYVEICNDGTVCALFSDGKTEPMVFHPTNYESLISKIEGYLYAERTGLLGDDTKGLCRC